MENQAKTSKFAMQNGVLFGVVLVLEFVIMYFADLDPMKTPAIGVVVNLLNYLIFPVLFISLAATQTKAAYGGFISFGEILKIGTLVAALGGLIYAVFYIIFNMLYPEFTDELMSKMEEQMRSQSPDMPEEQLEMALSMTKNFLNPWIAAPVSIIIYTIVGFIESLVIGAIVKNERH